MSEARTVAIRPQDYEVLKTLSQREEREMTAILHKALVKYLESSREVEPFAGEKVIKTFLTKET